MQFAKKLELIDPKLLDQLQTDREYKAMQRPAPAVAKMSLSLDIGRILNDQTIPDDEKVKLSERAASLRQHSPRSTLRLRTQRRNTVGVALADVAVTTTAIVFCRGKTGNTSETIMYSPKACQVGANTRIT